MDKKSKIFFLVFFLLIIGSVGVTYWRIMINRDYIISASQECDPATEACFVSSCDPESDEECAATPEEERTSYYKIIKKNAKNIPPCDAQKDECPAELTCADGEAECSFEYCDDSNVPDGEECNDPAVYNEENPLCDCGDTKEGTTEESELATDELADETASDDAGSEEEEPACTCTQNEESAGDNTAASEEE
jgi:hypothetical protein